jgi:hypothetical protein
MSEDLHEAARQAARRDRASLNAFVREAIAEKVGRAQLRDELDEIHARLDRLERTRKHTT